jgi:hypothetical protein
MAIEIAEPRATVWEALIDPGQMARWRPGVERLLHASSEYPALGQTARWRSRLHGLPIRLDETPLEVVPRERLRSRLRLGLFRFEQCFALGPHAAGCSRLSLKITTPSRMPLVGGSLDRFAVRRFSTDLAAATLQAVRDWCELGQATSVPLPDLPTAPVSARR